MNPILRFAAGWMLVSALSGQPSAIAGHDVAHIRQLLHSGNWRDKAWGAHFAAQLHSPELANDVIEEFRLAGAIASSSQSEQNSFVATLFGAAVEGGVPVPAALLEPFERYWDGPVLVLLSNSHDPDREVSLLRLSKARPDLTWLAANNLLFAAKSRNWYAQTLGNISIRHRFTVVDPGITPRKEDLIGGATCGDALTNIPPIPFYVLEGYPAGGGVLFAEGPSSSVSYRIVIVATNQQGGFGSCFSVNREEMLVGYVAALAKIPADKVEKLFHGTTIVSYQNASDFERRIGESLHAQEQGLRELAQAVRDGHGLGAAGTTLRLQVEVNDLRRNTAKALHQVASRQIVLD